MYQFYIHITNCKHNQEIMTIIHSHFLHTYPESIKNKKNISVSCKKCQNTNTFKNVTDETMIQRAIHSTSPLMKEHVVNITMLLL